MTSVLHVISGLGVGGAERVLVQLVGALQQRGMPQHIVSVTGSNLWANELAARRVPVETLDVRSFTGAAIGIFRLARTINRVKPDIVQGWMPHGNLFAALSHRLAGGHRQRGLMWGLYATNVMEPKHLRMVRLTALMSSWPDAIVTDSEGAVEYHLRHGYRPQRIEVIYNGIDTEKFRPDLQVRAAVRSSLKIGDDEILAIHVARLDPLKNHGMFLDALCASPKIRGLLVGAGTETLPLPENALALGPRSDVDQLYASADLVISTSSTESFGITVAEGMSSACVPIATDVGSFQMIIADTGRVIAPDDKKALIAALADAAALDRSERTALGMRARARIIERFSLQRMVDNYARLYASDA